MQKMLTSELTGRRFYFKGLKASDKSQGTSGNTKFKGKNDKQGSKSSAQQQQDKIAQFAFNTKKED
jgi:hypothetical protein